MKLRLFAAAAALTVSAGMTHATTINVSVFSVTEYNTILGTFTNTVSEDFEGFSEGNVADGFSTNVGTFRSVGGTGTGGTVTDPDLGFPGTNDGSLLAIRDGDVYGRRSTTALLTNDASDDKFLDSNDTHGIEWTVNFGSLFNRILLTMTDATDVGATMKITADGVSKSFSNLRGADNRRDGNTQIVLIEFGGPLSNAIVSFENFKGGNHKLNDGFSLDDIAVSVVPLPAPALLLLAGLGGLAAFRRKRAA